MKLLSKLWIFALVIVVFYGCKSKEVSQTTGWDYNNKDNGGFTKGNYHEQETGPSLVLIQGGTFLMGETLPNPVMDKDYKPRNVTIQTFYMDKTEVRNIDYVEYLYWLQRVYGGEDPLYREALPDTMVWLDRLAYNEPLSYLYLRHASFQNYPVVGVSWTQANAYCLWRSDRVNESILVKKGLLEWNLEKADPENGKYPFTTDAYIAGAYRDLVNSGLPDLGPNAEEGATRNANMSDGILLPNYRLPTEAEWEYAALAQIGSTVDERVYQRRFYPWDGNIVRNPKKKHYGRMMANYKRGRGDYAGVAQNLNDGAVITEECGSYWPNDFGLYNMAGNVAEWVGDVYRPLSHQDVSDLQPFRGNVFTENVLDSTTNKPLYDRSGHYLKQSISNVNRANFSKSDNVNYGDGDEGSLKSFDGSFMEEEDGVAIGVAEENGDRNITAIMYQKNRSLITDRSRVVKGGSWLDPVYYLNPAVRRYLDQDMSTNYIGFRCAMNRVGSSSGSKK